MYLSLTKYLEQAESCYRYYARRNPSEDDIAMVAEYMMRADNKYKQVDSVRDKFRHLYATYGVKAAKRKRQKDLDFFHNKESRLDLDKIIDTKPHYDTLDLNELCDVIRKNVSERDADIFISRFQDDWSITALAEKYNISPQRVFAIIARTKSILQERLQHYV